MNEYKYDDNGQIENNFIAMTKSTLDIFFNTDIKNSGDAVLLYVFYLYTSKWQKTNQPYATTGYSSKGTGLSETKIRSAKKLLLDNGLIEEVHKWDKNTKNFGKRYIKLNYMFRGSLIKTIVESNPHDFQQGCKSNRVAKHETNSYSVNTLNSYSVNKEKEEAGKPGIVLTKKQKQTEIYITYIISNLNIRTDRTKRGYKIDNKTTRNLIRKLLKNYDVREIIAVTDMKCEKGLKDNFLKQYLRPSTLFNANHFEDYINDVDFERYYQYYKNMDLEEDISDILKGVKK